MFGLLFDNKTAIQTALKFQEVKRALTAGAFSDLMPVMLADNGGEFPGVSIFENNLEGEKEAFFFSAILCSLLRRRKSKRITCFFAISWRRGLRSTISDKISSYSSAKFELRTDNLMRNNRNESTKDGAW